MRLTSGMFVLLFFATFTFAQSNLAPNPGFETTGDNGLPASWDTVMIGNPVQFAVDTQIKHSGKQSIRITAADSARAYFRSTMIPVSPGEKVHAGAWVKFKDVPEKMGTVILIAEWLGPDGRGSDVAKFDVAKRPGTSSDWQYIDGTQAVPENVAFMRIRLGFSYSQGTCWWDDVSASVDVPASIRIDLPTPRVTPAMPGLPLVILNRQGFKGPAKISLKIGKDSADFDIQLSGEPLQKITVPLPLGRQTGKVAIAATLIRSGKSIATATFASLVPPPLVIPPVLPTHWCVEDGAAKISGAIDLSAAPADLDQATLTLRVVSSTGIPIASQKWSVDQGNLATGRLIPFDLTIPGPKVGDYKILGELKGKQANFSAEQTWGVIPRRMAKTTLNAAGFPVHDGKAIWPMGIFNGGRFKEQGDAGFTVSHAYNAVRITPGRDPEDQRAKDFLDQSYANHQLALFMVPLKLAAEGDWDGFRRRIRLFKNHPGLLAWDEEEGLARGDWTEQIRQKAFQIVHEEDPNHPFMVGDSRDIITKMGDRSNFFDNSTMDLGMWWWYPYPLIGRGVNDLEGEEASASTTLEPPTFLVQRNTTKPVWTALQAYEKKGSRYPTPVEYRQQAYYGIIEGAQGLMWYGGGVTGGMHTKLKEGHWDYVQKLVTELKSLDWAWMSPTLQQIEQVSKDIPVSLIVKKGSRGTVIVAVNRGVKPVDVNLPALKATGSADVMGESRHVMFTASGLHEHFDSYGTHVYLIH
ncbi:MAG TPA: hypothetical protein VFE58_08540 [Tepidisphaeraceae bacterium]|jgi:hypothetical protein|nr:hypothetical protein [Tepidisphaeraceae bacterium]